MRLLIASGIVQPPTIDDVQADPHLWERLVLEACRFLRAGGSLTPDAWALFTPVERVALDHATKILATESATLHGIASQGLAAAAEVAAGSDQGALRSRMAMARAASQAAAAVMNEAPAGAPS